MVCSVVSLCGFIFRNGKEDILMNRIGDKRHSVINILMSKIGFFHDGLCIISRLKKSNLIIYLYLTIECPSLIIFQHREKINSNQSA